MARLTRNSYKRKVILFGVLIFMCIALISTGFAAWVMSNDAEAQVDGNVSVGVVSDAGLSFKDVDDENKNFYFEPVEDDNDGRIRHDGVNSESLKVEISGTLVGSQNLGELTYAITIPVGVADAIYEQYIAFKDEDLQADIIAQYTTYQTLEPNVKATYTGFTLEADITDQIDKAGASEQAFLFEIEFVWGVKFKGLNPSKYYDTYFKLDDENNVVPFEGIDGEVVFAGEGAALSNAECKKGLEDFRAYLYGYYDDILAAEDDAEALLGDGAEAEDIAAARAEARAKYIAETGELMTAPTFSVVITATNGYTAAPSE